MENPKHTKIKEGDIVNVFFEHVQGLYEMTVHYVPCATGDSWHLTDRSGNIKYVSAFSLMEKIRCEDKDQVKKKIEKNVEKKFDKIPDELI